MDNSTTWAVYETVLGHMLPEHAVPGVKNLFQEGAACDQLYENMSKARRRISKRLGSSEEDQDLEVIIDSMNNICALVSQEMFRCGIAMGRQTSV